MDNDQQAADAIKELMMERKKSRWPLIVGILLLVGILGGAGYWWFGGNAGQTSPSDILARAQGFISQAINKPIIPASDNANAPHPEAAKPAPPREDDSLISK